MLHDKVKELPHHFWKKESGLTSMLILLFLNDFLIGPLFGSIQWVRFVINLLWMLILLTGIFSLAKSRKHAFLISILPFCFVILRWLLLFIQNKQLVFFDFAIGLLTMFMLIGMVLIKVFEHGPVTTNRIVGSVVVYMLTGNLFCLVFQFIYMLNPSCFDIRFSSTDISTIHSGFIYFSFTTLTTTGYGDILPIGLFTRSMVVVEQIIGVLYPVVLIGRLVSLKVERD
jgi:hypothetical protein